MLAKLNLQITDLGYAQIVEHLGKVNIITSSGKIIATRNIGHPSWNESAYEVKNNLCLFERPFKIQKNGVFLFEISFFVLEISTFFYYAN